MKKLLALGSTSITVLGLLTVAAPASVHAATSVPQLSWKGTITMYAQNNTPAAPGLNTLPSGKKLTQFERAAKAFEKLYPGIHIKFVYDSTYGTPQWYETEGAAGNLPDVTWVQYSLTNSTLPKGMFTNLLPYFNKSNPYIHGNRKWSSIMNPRVLSMTAAPDGSQYVVDGSWVGTAFYYNKDLFAKAGIKQPPHTWEELVADSKKLTGQGITAGTMQPQYGWFSAIFAANALGSSDLKKLVSYTPGSVGTINGNDEVKGYDKGFFNPAKNPRLMAWWPAMKQLYRYWDPTTLSESASQSLPAGAPTGESQFLAGKAAMTFDGTWLPPMMSAVPKSQRFPIGSFNLTSLKGSSPFATNLVTSMDVGGPSGGFQYGIPSQQADHSMTPAKLQAVLDWVRFFSTPKWDQAITDEKGANVPTFKGTKPTAADADLAKDLNKPYYQLYPFLILTSQANTQTENLFTEYVNGQISFADARQQFDQLAQQAVTQYKSQNNMQ